MKKTAILILLLLVFLMPVTKAASYEIWIQDDAQLLTDAEEQELRNVMEGILPYGHALFWTTDISGTAASKAESWYNRKIGSDSGVLFMIDMYSREIYLWSNGRIYRTVTRTEAYNITDNVYRLASAGRYGECAEKAFRQVLTLLKGGMIARPMKLICNILLALGLSSLLVSRILLKYEYDEDAERKKRARRYPQMKKVTDGGARETKKGKSFFFGSSQRSEAQQLLEARRRAAEDAADLDAVRTRRIRSNPDEDPAMLCSTPGFRVVTAEMTLIAKYTVTKSDSDGGGGGGGGSSSSGGGGGGGGGGGHGF